MKIFLLIAGAAILLVLLLIFIKLLISHKQLINDDFFSLDLLTQEELNWLISFYENETKTKYDRDAGGLSTIRRTIFRINVLKSIKENQLTEAQLDDVTERLYERINSIPLRDRDEFEENILIKLLKTKELEK